jgi:hypothetical protein
MKASLLGIDLAANGATIVDSGDEPFSTTNLDLIGQAVASILKKPEETANQYLSEYKPLFKTKHCLGYGNGAISALGRC